MRRTTRFVWCGSAELRPARSHGSVQAVAAQLGFGSESVRAWVRQADIDDGVTAGTSTADADRIKALEQELKEVKRANAILKSASAFFAAELDRPHR